MTLAILDSVVLTRDLPEYSLRKGDLGAVVEVYSSEAVEVEFVTAGGQTQALATIDVRDLRHLIDSDVIAVREKPLDPTG